MTIEVHYHTKCLIFKSRAKSEENQHNSNTVLYGVALVEIAAFVFDTGNRINSTHFKERLPSSCPNLVDTSQAAISLILSMKMLELFCRMPTLKTAMMKEHHIYSIFQMTWTTFKFNRNQLGTALAYVM